MGAPLPQSLVRGLAPTLATASPLLVMLYGQQVSTTASLRTTEGAPGATRLKLGADWLDVPEPVATLLRQHLANRANMTTIANPDSPWLFPGQLAGEHRSYRRLVRVLDQLGIPARASGWPPGANSSGRHHPPSSPTRWASRRAWRCATRSSAPPTGPPTPPSGMRTPRAMFRMPISEPDSATARSTMWSGNVPGTVRA